MTEKGACNDTEGIRNDSGVSPDGREGTRREERDEEDFVAGTIVACSDMGNSQTKVSFVTKWR